MGNMKKLTPKKPRTLKIEPQVKKKPSKPKKTKLSKSDPNYFSIIGKRSAKKRAISSEQFAEWARLSHTSGNRKGKSKGGRPRKNPDA